MRAQFDWSAEPARPYLGFMRSLPIFPLLLLLLGLLLCTGDSWAGSADDAPAPTTPPSADSSSEKEPTETESHRRTRLTQERDAVMAELLALEEGYSDLKSADNKDENVSEARLSARLTQLQTRLDHIELELAKSKKNKKSTQ